MTDGVRGRRSQAQGPKDRTRTSSAAPGPTARPPAPRRPDAGRSARRGTGPSAVAAGAGSAKGRPSLTGTEAPPRQAAAAGAAAQAARAAECKRIEDQLKATGIAWSGLDEVPRDGLASGDLTPGLGMISRLPLVGLARELERLPLGGTVTLVAEDSQDRWIALREAEGVRVAREGTAEAAALEVTHRARGDLDFLGAKVEARDGVLQLVDPPPTASVAKRLGLAMGDRILGSTSAPGDVPPSSLQVLHPGAKLPEPLAEGSDELQAGLEALRQRLHGVAVPVGHWLAEVGVTPGALLAAASIDGSSVWDTSKPLAELDAARDAALSLGKALVLALVSAEGYEQHTLTGGDGGRLAPGAAPRVAVTLTGHARKGSEVRALLTAGAPYGFAVDRAEGGASPTESTESPAAMEPPTPVSVPGIDDRAVAEYRAMASFALQESDPSAQAQLSPEEQQRMDEAVRRQLERQRAFARRLAAVTPGADDRVLAGQLARLELEDALAAQGKELEATTGAARTGDEPQPPMARGPVARERLELADALVAAANRVAKHARLGVEAKNARIGLLANAISSKYWYLPKEELAAMASEVTQTLSAIADGPATAEEELASSPPPAAYEAEAAKDQRPSGELRQRPQSDPKLLESRVRTLEGIRDSLRTAIAAGEHDFAYGLERAFQRDATGMRLDTVQQRYRDLKRITDEVGAACDRLEQELGGAAGPYARSLISLLNDAVLGGVRGGNVPAEPVLKALAAHRALIDGDLAAASRAPAGAPAQGEPSAAGAGTRFATRDALEAFVRDWGERHPGQNLRLHAPDGMPPLEVMNDPIAGWSVRAGSKSP